MPSKSNYDILEYELPLSRESQIVHLEIPPDAKLLKVDLQVDRHFHMDEHGQAHGGKEERAIAYFIVNSETKSSPHKIYCLHSGDGVSHNFLPYLGTVYTKQCGACHYFWERI